jgi:hypothetical protein
VLARGRDGSVTNLCYRMSIVFLDLTSRTGPR